MLHNKPTLIYSLVLLLHSNQALDVFLPVVEPPGARHVSRSLISLSLEQDRWTDWAGTTQRNEFFFNTLDNIAQIAGESMQIRFGANSEDHTKYDPDGKFSQATFPAASATVPYPEAVNITIGDGFYQVVQWLPPGTRVIVGLNFGGNNVSMALRQTQSILKAFDSPAVRNSNIVLEAIEFGNEPDLYPNNGLRAKTYNSAQYTREWNEFANNVTLASGISSTKFWGASFATSSHSTTGFSPQAIFENGILNSRGGALISTISQHHYSGSFCTGSGGLLQDLMTKSTIRSNLTRFIPDIIAVRARGLDYLFGEANSYACHGAPGVSNAAGAALWTLDYALFAATIGITRIFFHDGIGFKYNLIQPIALIRSILDGTPLPTISSAHVQPQYYAAIIAAEAIGSTGDTHIAELPINNTRLAGYSFFEAGKLSRVLLINSEAFLQGTATRGALHVNFNVAEGSTSDFVLTIKRLKISHADDATGLTWAGQTYETETEDGRAFGGVTEEFVPLSSGIDIQATEVVLLSFN